MIVGSSARLGTARLGLEERVDFYLQDGLVVFARLLAAQHRLELVHGRTRGGGEKLPVVYRSVAPPLLLLLSGVLPAGPVDDVR